MSRMKATNDAFIDAHVLHSVDTSRSKDGVWLVKVPKYLAELWNNAGPDGIVGKVVIATEAGSDGGGGCGPIDSSKRPGSQVTLETDSDLLAKAGESASLIPREHQFLIHTSTTSPNPPNKLLPNQQRRVVGAMSGQELIILAEDDLAVSTTASTTTTISSTSTSSSAAAPTPTPSSSSSTDNTIPFSNAASARYARRLSLFGRVNSRAECRPPPNARYMMLKAQQLKTMNRPKHEVQLLYEPVRNYKPIANHTTNIEYEARKRAEGKNLRREREDVMQDLFKAFERHQYYTIRDLILLTKQPVTYLTEILKEIATFNPRAPHKNMWELKPEYRHYTPSETAAPNSGKDLT